MLWVLIEYVYVLWAKCDKMYVHRFQERLFCLLTLYPMLTWFYLLFLILLFLLLLFLLQLLLSALLMFILYNPSLPRGKFRLYSKKLCIVVRNVYTIMFYFEWQKTCQDIDFLFRDQFIHFNIEVPFSLVYIQHNKYKNKKGIVMLLCF